MENVYAYEYEILKLSGLNEHEFHSYPVWFSFTEKDWRNKDIIEGEEEGRSSSVSTNTSTKEVGETKQVYSLTGAKAENEYIWTYEFGLESNPVLLIIHGYGGSGMIFYKMFKELNKYFHVYLIDVLGMGRSCRNVFKCKTYEE